MTTQTRPNRGILKRHSIFEGSIVPDLTKSHGSWIVDAADGQEYLDFFTYFSTSALGHNHPRLRSTDCMQELAEAAVDKPSLSDVQPDEMVSFLETFERVAVPEELPHLFFISGGALAVENALKTAFDWKIRKNLEAGKGERGTEVVHFAQAFHGRSGYTLSLTNTSDPRKTQYFPKFNWPRITNPKCTFPLEGANLERTVAHEQKALEELKAVLAERGPDIAALILEPIQCEGGDNHFRAEFFQALRQLCDEHDVFFVVDEVQTGLGPSGKMWCFQHFGFTPDAVAFGKKTQVCGIMVSRRVDEIADNVFTVPSRINSTWGGNLVDMVRSKHILQAMEADGLVENARQRGEQFVARLNEVAAQVSGERMSNVRGRGVLCAFDLPSTEDRDRFLDDLQSKGKMMGLSCGDRSVRFRPALTVSSEEIDEAANRVLDTLQSDG